ncbi:hypothetical protein BJF87_21245 [Gordonia sp. CNJ-863]|uniref:helix-turn-helix domain-containing protein n=1 Tax=Gordonia sp. CNJ-863 TaxID=1904963 RepID=UPI0009699B6E|nr:helix-turn-helix domain-containing protein [Gordonia sp. CNJ-863]OLT47743.1 hypothetical protein BJF87_21245 [Gordonia sp. CNJ-863]
MSATDHTPTHDPSSQCARLLKHLKKHRRITNRQLISMGIFRGSARIKDLRDEGWIIVTNRVHRGLFEFVLVGLRDED